MCVCVYTHTHKYFNYISCKLVSKFTYFLIYNCSYSFHNTWTSVHLYILNVELTFWISWFEYNEIKFCVSWFEYQKSDANGQLYAALWFWRGSSIIPNWPVKQVFPVTLPLPLPPTLFFSSSPSFTLARFCLIHTGFSTSISGGSGMKKMRTMTLITLFGVWSLGLGCKCPLCVRSLPQKHDRITLNKSVIPAAQWLL